MKHPNQDKPEPTVRKGGCNALWHCTTVMAVFTGGTGLRDIFLMVQRQRCNAKPHYCLRAAFFNLLAPARRGAGTFARAASPSLSQPPTRRGACADSAHSDAMFSQPPTRRGANGFDDNPEITFSQPPTRRGARVTPLGAREVFSQPPTRRGASGPSRR